ncbi:unnamed protein product [Brassica rapa]|uniref:Uncharacterized protein n=1 Tax=Brassica campestris TaxID=3711 RepID=A0A8D9H5N8_BRACM|nr:unnamed protein product [Brassica rapa]
MSIAPSSQVLVGSIDLLTGPQTEISLICTLILTDTLCLLSSMFFSFMFLQKNVYRSISLYTSNI